MIPTLCRSGILINRSPLDFGGGLSLAEATDPAPQPDRGTDIGMVVFLTHKKEQAEAILDVEGTWRCPKLPVLDRVLNILHDPKRNPGGDKPFGYAELIRVAAWFQGEARFHRPRRADAGRRMCEAIRRGPVHPGR